MSDESVYQGHKHPVCAYICVDDAEKAIDFYMAAFGAVKTMEPIIMEDGKVGHVELSFGGATIMMADEFPGMNTSPKTLGGTTVNFVFAVEDADSAVAKAVEAGCELTRPVQDQFYGDRSGTVKDPFGYSWTLSHHIEDLTNEEIAKRGEELYGGDGDGA